MNNKQKVLKILDKHRDMSLTAGCIVQPYGINCEANYFTIIHKPKNREDYRCVNTYEDKEVYKWFDEDMIKFVLGHPATPLVLLKALDAGEGHAILDSGGTLVVFENEYDDQPLQIQIPDVTTLTELPHTHQLWTDLLPILS